MISSASFFSYIQCSNQKNYDSVPSALMITSIAAEILIVAVAACVLIKGVGVVPVLLITGATLFLVEGIFSSYLICRKKTDDPELVSESQVGIESKTEIKLVEDPVKEVVRTQIKIKERDRQVERFVALKSTQKDTVCLECCDRFSNASPTNACRIYLKGDKSKPTNGALLKNGDIQIQGPAKPLQAELMWCVAAERDVKAIVRIGKDHLEGGCCLAYTPEKDFPIQYPKHQLSIFSKEVAPRPISPTVVCKEYEMRYETKTSDILVYAFEGWPDHDITECDAVITLIQDLEKIKGPIMVHCRGGIGRSGTFIICREIYQRLVASQVEELSEIEVDPAQIVEDLRDYRQGAVEQKIQFEMILAFIDMLNSRSQAGLI